MSRGYRNGRRRAGFTLAEVLVAVGIVVVLLAVAIPSLAALRDNLKLTELDDCARTLFAAAQNRLTALRASGELDRLNGVALTAQPGDFADTGLSWETDTYFYVNQETAGDLLPFGAVDETVRGGHYVIEYNAKTAAVYAVFYAEDAFAYDSALPRTDRAARKAHTPALGYYGGSGVAQADPTQTGTPVFTLVNGEQLYVKLTPAQDTQYVVTVSGAVGVASFSFRDNDMGAAYDNLHYVTDPAGAYYKLVLDGLDAGERFQTLFDGSGLVPGEDLTVTVTAAGTGSLPATATALGNSLFAGRSGDTALVANGRHLQNLDSAFSGVDTGVAAAVQTADIVWDPARGFDPIDNAALLAFDGGWNEIRDLTVTDTALNYSGLFGSVTGATLENILLCNPVIQGGARTGAAGALAGAAIYTEISGCRVYADAAGLATSCVTAASTTGAAGGLVGSGYELTVRNSFASLPRIDNKGVAAGGLVGMLIGGSATGCYADTGVLDAEGNWTGGLTGANTAGGLIGAATDVTLTNCYAVGWLAAPTAGGLLGTDTSAAMSDCYSAVTFAETVRTLRPLSWRGTRSNCYYLAEDPAAETTPAGVTALDWKGMATCLSGAAWSVATESTTQPYGATGAYPFPRLNGLPHCGDWPLEQIELGLFRLAYYEHYPDGTSPFTYGYYAAVGFDDDKTAFNTLRDDVPVLDDGYCLIAVQSTLSTTALTVNYTTAAGAASYAFKTQTGVLTYNKVRYSVYRMPATNAVLRDSVPIAGSDGYYNRLNANDEVFYFNPSFAKTAVNGAGQAVPTLPAQIELRTARHLAALGTLSGRASLYWSAARRYVQDREIDFSTYTGPRQTLTPIGTAAAPFYASYDGGGHLITGAGIAKAGVNNVGLFGYLGGSVRDVTFVSDLSGTAVREISGADNVGALAGTNAGTITNCAVAGFHISGGSNVGGLAGNNVGTITNCSAANGSPSSDAERGGAISGTANVGGFVGRSSGTIRNCYAVARLSGSGLSGFAGAFSGGAVNACYCTSYDGERETYLSFAPTVPDGCYALGRGLSFAQLTALALGSNWGLATEANTHPYQNSGAHPYPAVVTRGGQTVHYGDWAYPDLDNAELAYYELYQTSGNRYTVGFWSERLGLNTLRDDLAPVLDGYAVLFRRDSNGNTSGGTNINELPESITLTYPSGGKTVTNTGLLDVGDLKDSANGNIAVANLNHNGAVEAGGEDYVPMFLPAAAVATDGTAAATFWQSLAVEDANGNSRTFWYNPHFAKSPVGVNGAPRGAAAVSLRTERHFATLASTQSAAWWGAGVTYTQERDLSFGSANPYQSNYLGVSLTGTNARYRGECVPLGSSAAPFSATYDGGSNSLSGLSYVTGDGGRAVGVFGYLTGTVRALTLQGVSISGSGAQVGALAGSAVGATITAVNVNSPSLVGVSQVGGAIGLLDGGSVSGLTVQNGSVNAARQAGGVVGLLRNGGNLTVDNVTVGGISVTTALTALPAGVTADTGCGTGGFAGALVLDGEGLAALQSVSVNGVTVRAGDFCAGAAAFLGALYDNTGCAPLLGGITLTGSSITGYGAAADSAYGLFFGRVRSVGALAFTGLSQSGCALRWYDGAENAASACFGGAIGLLMGSESAQENNKLILTLPGGSLAGLTLDLSGVGTADVGGFVGRTGANTVLLGQNFTLSGGRVTGGSGSTGGFVGASAGTISNCSVDNVARVSGSGSTGGFVGTVVQDEITACDVRLSGWLNQQPNSYSQTNSVAGSGGNTGGFAGAVTGSGAAVIDCFAAIPVAGAGGNTGGFVGLVESGRVERCYASCDVSDSGGGNTGGFVGLTRRGNSNIIPLLSACYATGGVEVGAESGYTGGFVGRSEAGSILSAYSAGAVGRTSDGNLLPNAANSGNTGGFIGYGAGLSVNAEDAELNQVLVSMVTFYNVLQTTKVVNRKESAAIKLPDGTLDTTNCMNVISYLELRGLANNTLQIDSEVIGNVEGTWNDKGVLTADGAVSWNVTQVMNRYPELQRGVWMATWENGEVVVYWCVAENLSGYVKTYKYVNATGAYYVGETQIKSKSAFGGADGSYLVLENPRNFVTPLEMPATMTINGTFRYGAVTAGGQINTAAATGQAGENAYCDYQYVGITRWQDADFEAELSAENKMFLSMAAVEDTQGYYGSGLFPDYPFPALPHTGCGVTRYAHWGRWLF